MALGRRYGNTVPRTRKDAIKTGIWIGLQKIFLTILGIIFIPFAVVYLLYIGMFSKDKTIYLNKFIKANNGKQQNTEDKN